MNRLLISAGVVVVSTTLFLYINNRSLKVENELLKLDKERVEAELKQVKKGVEDVKKIKGINAINPDDVIKRMRDKGYLRSE